jgi:aminoglycoside phosphotransferase (APT) family kinase protein
MGTACIRYTLTSLSGKLETSVLIDHVRRSVIAASALGFNAVRLTIDPILNWGGFVNRSFRLSDGHSTAVLKLASTPEARHDLERWRSFASVLTRQYHAPRMLAWIDVESIDSAGPVFEWVQGSTPERLDSVPLDALRAVLDNLHSDAHLAAALAGLGDPVESCEHAYRRCYHRRFIADLEFIAATPPPFVTAAALEWMHAEVAFLEREISASEAFAEPASRPAHSDLWLNNLIVGPTSWYILDWDGLTLGDAAMDWAMLFGPTRLQIRPSRSAADHAVSLGAGARERLRWYGRASALDWIIDPLSDWVQSWNEPFHGEPIRIANERVHREAMVSYNARFGIHGSG